MPTILAPALGLVSPAHLLGFSVTLRTPGHTLALPMLAYSSGEAAETAMSYCPEHVPFGLVVKPAAPKPGTPTAEALRIYRRKCALADLVE